MTATTMPDTVRLGFGRLLRSEWIKLRSIRSTWWCYAILVVVTVGMAALLGNAVGVPDPDQPKDALYGGFVNINTVSVSLTALVVGVLGVLIITGEYGTGQVRSTFTADPRRTGVILAKATVLAVTTFVVSVVSTWIGVLLSAALQSAKGAEMVVSDPSVFLPILGSSVYVTLLALLAYGIGLLLRSSAGGIAVTVGILLVLPILLSGIGTLMAQQWVLDIAKFLPDQAGMQLYTYSYTGVQQDGVVLNGWGGFAVLAAEVVVVGALALTVARRRDV
ncbi:ABC transporter permease [Curtobacterium sp. 1544]|uniref:ABC transporter permease n=1 Tax=Curtobacterium sp. 1544 TaxID=3156417 RepID=UPI003392B164